VVCYLEAFWLNFLRIFIFCVLHVHPVLINITMYSEEYIGACIAQWYSAGLRAGWSGGSSPGRGWEFFSSPPRPERLWGPPSLLSDGYRGLVKRTGHEADHSPPSKAKVKNAWSYTSALSMSWWHGAHTTLPLVKSTDLDTYFCVVLLIMLLLRLWDIYRRFSKHRFPTADIDRENGGKLVLKMEEALSICP
jgi:hypothetical protein